MNVEVDKQTPEVDEAIPPFLERKPEEAKSPVAEDAAEAKEEVHNVI